MKSKEELVKEIALLEQEQGMISNVLREKRSSLNAIESDEYKNLVGKYYITKSIPPNNDEFDEFWLTIYKVLSMASANTFNIEQKFFDYTGYVEASEQTLYCNYFVDKQEISETLYNKISDVIDKSLIMHKEHMDFVNNNYTIIKALCEQGNE